MKLPDKVATIVIGNPLIADASLQTGGQMVITGKGYGMTNIIALDRAGHVLMDRSVEVQGTASATWSSSITASSAKPTAARRSASGASRSATATTYFDATIGQTDLRSDKAQGRESARKVIRGAARRCLI